MTLWTLYNTWEKRTSDNMVILDRDGKAYDLTNISNKELWDMEVKSFYFNNGTLVVRLS